jgi:hypothetical protein
MKGNKKSIGIVWEEIGLHIVDIVILGDKASITKSNYFSKAIYSIQPSILTKVTSSILAINPLCPSSVHSLF